MDGMGWYERELPGIILVIAYMALLPPLLAKTIMRGFFIKMGFVRVLPASEFDPVHGRLADQDGAALDDQPQVHREHSGVFL